MGLLLFLPAGTIRYWQASVYLAVFVGASFVITLYLLRNDPALLRRRLSGGPTAEKERGIAANPKGQVPVLVDDDLTLFDSTVILEYLEDAYPIPPLYPTDPKGKARCRLVELYAEEILLADVRRLMYRSEPPLADAERQKARQEEGQRGEAGILGHYRRLEAQLGSNGYFCGVFTAADIAMFMTVHYLVRLDGPRLDPFPALADWYRRIVKRSSSARVLQEIAKADRTLSWPLSA
jgi:glutathione S-transferase